MAPTLPVIRSVNGRAVTVPGDDVDTDRIIPARFMKCVTFDGLGEYAFYDERFETEGVPRPNHPLNREEFAGASILLAGSNFGCGSSREHAPQALYRFGFRGLVAVSFAEIFFGNAIQLGMPCLSLDRDGLAELAALVGREPQTEVTLDVEAIEVRAGPLTLPAQLPEGARSGLLEGRWDPLTDLLAGAPVVETVASALPYWD